MSALFDPFVDPTIRDNRLSTTYSKKTVTSIHVPHTTDREEYLSEPVSLKKSKLLLLVFSVGIVLLVGRVFQLQIARGETYKALADGNRIRIEYLQAARGIISDRDAEPLVKNIPNFSVTITPVNLPDDPSEYQAVLSQTANILEMPLSELQSSVKDHSETLYNQPLTLREFIPYEQALEISTEVNRLPGVDVLANASREYVDPEVFSHVIGYLGRMTEQDITQQTNGEYLLTDSLGKNGLEYEYESALRGTKGKQQVEVDAIGNEIEVVAKEESQPGSDLTLSIDADLQRTLYQALGEMADAKDTPGGAAVAIDPMTGRVLALVSYPGFDINLFTKGIGNEDYTALLNDERKPLFNKAIQGEYPSGSTFKLIVAAAALQEGVITPSSTIQSTGGVKINQWFFPDWKAGGHGQTDVRKAIAESVNSFFYYAGGGTYNEEELIIEGGLGIERIDHYAERFGLNTTSQVDLPGEASGFLPTKEWKESFKGEQWYIGDTYNTSIGQGDVLVTPLQVAQYTSVVANNGTLYSPKIVYTAQTDDNQIEYTVDPVVIDTNIIDPYYLQIVREGMRMAVTDGSAKALQNLPVAVAAKTGTAQVSGTERTHSWLTAFAPYDNPEIVITVLVEEGGEGTEAALPVARQGLQTFFTQ